LRGERLRFRIQRAIMNCRPDIVFSKERLVVFVDGDFWHGRLMVECGITALQTSFREECRSFWVAKIVRNVTRDGKQARLLRRHGWSVVRLWESDVLQNPNAAVTLIRRRLQRRRWSD
jgi:DNA mismatch endonuclease (patch repair protein)